MVNRNALEWWRAEVQLDKKGRAVFFTTQAA